MVMSIFHIYLVRVFRSLFCISLRLQVNAIGFVAAAANVTAAGVVVDYVFFQILLLSRRLSWWTDIVSRNVCKCQKSPDCSTQSE